jgi:mRNA-degrading endonuclease RelE of RelBE toxin-antitoxin system
VSWAKLDKVINAHSLMEIDACSSRDYGVKLTPNFPYHKVKFTCQALAMLAQLNDYDQTMVENEIKQICANPNSINAVKHSRNPFRRLWRTKYPFRSYHYLVAYTYKDNQINISDILFDRKLQGEQTKHSAEHTMLYEVKRLTAATYNKATDQKGIEALESAWNNAPQPVTQVNTMHAAVNGMQNELTKATWLMGTHLDTAYQSDGIQAYTLFHNPTDKAALDVVECAFDKRLGSKSHNAQHLAAILAQNNQQGKKVKWIAHSQGAIIFCAALEHYNIQYSKRLTTQEIAIHGSGANIDRLKRVASRVGMTINAIRNNPFDLVPNIAGANDLSASSLVRSIKFRGLVFGDEVGASPHTLPFLGLETYADQLQLLGNLDKSTTVRKFIRKLPKGVS